MIYSTSEKKLFSRYCHVKIHSRESGEVADLSYPEPGHSIEFETEFTATRESGTLKFYNPSQKVISLSQIEKGKIPLVTIIAGYEDNHAQSFTGRILASSLKKDSEHLLELKISDLSSLFYSLYIQKSYSGPIKASDVIRSVFSGVSQNVEIKIKTDPVYERGISFNQRLDSVIAQLAKATKSKFLFSRSRPMFVSRDKGLQEIIHIAPEHGLLSAEPKSKVKKNVDTQDEEEVAKSYLFRMLYIPQVGPSAVLQYRNQNFLVKKGKKVFSTFSDSYIESEAVAK